MAEETIRVLLIEDVPADALLIRRMLGASGNPRFDVDHAENLHEALELLKSRRYDVLLLDLGLPDSRGIQTISKTIAAAPDVPIIVLTVVDVPQTILDAIRIGVGDYIVK